MSNTGITVNVSGPSQFKWDNTLQRHSKSHKYYFPSIDWVIQGTIANCEIAAFVNLPKGFSYQTSTHKDERDNDTVDIKFKDSHGGTEKNMYSAMFPYSGSGQTNGKYLAKEYKHPSTPTVTDDRAKPQFAAIVLTDGSTVGILVRYKDVPLPNGKTGVKITTYFDEGEAKQDGTHDAYRNGNPTNTWKKVVDVIDDGTLKDEDGTRPAYTGKSDGTHTTVRIDGAAPGWKKGDKHKETRGQVVWGYQRELEANEDT